MEKVNGGYLTVEYRETNMGNKAIKHGIDNTCCYVITLENGKTIGAEREIYLSHQTYVKHIEELIEEAPKPVSCISVLEFNKNNLEFIWKKEDSDYNIKEISSKTGRIKSKSNKNLRVVTPRNFGPTPLPIDIEKEIEWDDYFHSERKGTRALSYLTIDDETQSKIIWERS